MLIKINNVLLRCYVQKGEIKKLRIVQDTFNRIEFYLFHKINILCHHSIVINLTQCLRIKILTFDIPHKKISRHRYSYEHKNNNLNPNPIILSLFQSLINGLTILPSRFNNHCMFFFILYLLSRNYNIMLSSLIELFFSRSNDIGTENDTASAWPVIWVYLWLNLLDLITLVISKSRISIF